MEIKSSDGDFIVESGWDGVASVVDWFDGPDASADAMPYTGPGPIHQDVKPTNPKDAIGCDRLPLHLWPETASALGCLGLLDGALKYGRLNWRNSGVRATIYVDAARRHLAAWLEGEDFDSDSGLPHLAHALACLAIPVDAMAAGKLVDDRQYVPQAGAWRAWLEELTPHVARLREKHKDRNPKHWTAADNE